jgi:nucleotide-binding universal stress UspA family protein
MTYKTILVHIDSGHRCRARVDIAIGLARRFDAHLIGLNALSPVSLPGYVRAEVGGMPIAEIQKRYADEQVARAMKVFDDAVAAAGLASAEWRTTETDAVDAVALHGRYADLVVLGQPEPGEETGVRRDFAEQVTLEAGRPVLMIPYAGSFTGVGKRVLVGWNASREATRAITDAMPLLVQADSVEIIVINPKPWEHGASPGSDLALYLARHGVRVEVRVDDASGVDEGGEMLSRAADFGADLIVMGAYGHSRFRELVMGGASRTIIDSMTVPVLLSH